MTCARCEDLEEEVAYLRSELGVQQASTVYQRLRHSMRFRAGKSSAGRPQAANLVAVLYAAKGRVVSRLQIMDGIPSPSGNDDRDPKIVDVWVCKARASLGHDAIQNAWGKGYAMTPAGMARVSAILNPPGEDALLDHCREVGSGD